MNTSIESFYEITPTLANYWRSIILFGKNTTSYKFAFGKSLLELSYSNSDLIKIEDLAKLFSRHICEHLALNIRQGTSKTNTFLSKCAAYNQNELNEAELVKYTTQNAFKYVLDAFHTVNSLEITTRFFIDEIKLNKGIRLTDNLYQLREEVEFQNLSFETEARWKLVEYAWNNNINTGIIEYNSDTGTFFRYNQLRRIDLTSSRDALNGYQKGRCFYCFDFISLDSIHQNFADVDHFFPFKLKDPSVFGNINGIWNLVLACKSCNRGENGKFDKLPKIFYLERLSKRNEYLINSHHPLRETLIKQTGQTNKLRQHFLQTCYNYAKINLIHNWSTIAKDIEAF